MFIGFLATLGLIILAICISVDSVDVNKLNVFTLSENLAAWAQAIYLCVFAAVIYACHGLVEQSNAILTHQSAMGGLHVNRLMDIIGVLLLILSVLFIMVAYIDTLSW